MIFIKTIHSNDIKFQNNRQIKIQEKSFGTFQISVCDVIKLEVTEFQLEKLLAMEVLYCLHNKYNTL